MLVPWRSEKITSESIWTWGFFSQEFVYFFNSISLLAIDLLKLFILFSFNFVRSHISRNPPIHFFFIFKFAGLYIVSLCPTHFLNCIGALSNSSLSTSSYINVRHLSLLHLVHLKFVISVSSKSQLFHRFFYFMFPFHYFLLLLIIFPTTDFDLFLFLHGPRCIIKLFILCRFIFLKDLFVCLLCI